MPGKELPKYLFKREEPRKALSEKESIRMMRREIASGKGNKPKKPIPAEYLKRQAASVRVEKRVSKVRPPNWVKTHLARHSPISEVVDQLLKRLDRIPSEQILIETQIGLNELGRRKGGDKLLRELLTQELVNKYLKKGA